MPGPLAIALAIFSFLGAGQARVWAQEASAKPIQQLKSDFVEWRFGMFLHFGMETFTGDYWSNPAPPSPEKFALASVDCRNWADGAKSAGMTFGVLTAKHHYGFCLWNTATTDYNSFKYGPKKDIVREYVEAFRAAGLKPGLYYSILDAKQGIAAGHGVSDRSVWNAKKELILGQLRELLTRYGDIPFLVLDGWAWQSGHNNIPLGEIRALVKSLQPNCLLSDHNGMTDPWDNDILMFEEPKDVYAPAGNAYAAAQGQTLNGHWFWGGDATVRSTAYILDHLDKLQPRYTNFLLNCPPNAAGVLPQSFLARLADVGKSWTPAARAALPAQPPGLEHPVTPIGAVDDKGAPAWNAIDGFNDVSSGINVTQTLWTGSGSLPQSVILDLGAKHYDLDMLSYLPRQDQTAGGYVTTGNITGYKIYVSDDKSAFRQVAAGAWAGDKTLKSAQWSPPAAGRYVRLEAASTAGNAGAVINEIAVGGGLSATSLAPTALASGRGGKRLKERNGSGPAAGATGLFSRPGEEGAPLRWSDATGRNIPAGKPTASGLE